MAEECRTPRCKIPAAAYPPPPPRKKAVVVYSQRPKEGYFQPADVELFLALCFRAPQPMMQCSSDHPSPRSISHL